MSTYTAHSQQRLRLWDKVRFLLAVGMAMLLFLSVGELATAPVDPLGAISLLTHPQAPLMVLEMGSLAAVIAALATVLIGSKLPDVGVFAAGLGVGLVSLRGHTATYLLMISTAGNGPVERTLAVKLMFESLIWFAVIAVAMIVSGFVMRWCQPAGIDDAPGEDDMTGEMAISECPVLADMVDAHGSEPPDRIAGLRFTIVTGVVAAIVFAILASGSRPITIEHGQVCFAAFAAFYVAVWLARSLFFCRTAFWSLLAIPLASVISGVWSLLMGSGSSSYDHLVTVPASDFLRVLPMTYVGAASVGVVTAHWTTRDAHAKTHRA